MKKHSAINHLLEIMMRLRAPGGCPWDNEQSHATLKPYLIEEAYEVIQAIDSGDKTELKDELGDLLLQVVFHAEIARQDGLFDFNDVAQAIADKLIRRHPHVFSDKTVNSSADVVANWDEIKQTEKMGKGIESKSLLDDVPLSFPALMEAQKLGKKAGKTGFDWENASQVQDKIREEFREIDEALVNQNQDALEEECGDLLFSVVQLLRHHKVNAELALKKANEKFRKRFSEMENSVASTQKSLHDLSASEWDDLWKKAKKH